MQNLKQFQEVRFSLTPQLAPRENQTPFKCSTTFDAHFERMLDAAEPMIEFEPAINALEPN